MQIFTSIVATTVCIVEFFVSGDLRYMKKEAEHFTVGKFSYYMTLIRYAIGWQVCYVGALGLIFLVSSLFSNVISTLALPNESSIRAKALVGIGHRKKFIQHKYFIESSSFSKWILHIYITQENATHSH